MEKSIKNKWIKALKSGEYRQARGKLKRGSRMCCLGVLCDIIDPKGWKKNTFYFKDTYNNGSLSDSVLSYSKLEEEEMNHCIIMNDEDKLSFEEIAKYIKENL